MSVPSLLEGIASRAASGATVKNVYGDPVIVGDRTIIPIAQVKYAFGGGGGGRTKNGAEDLGGGGGGACLARPVGALEVTRTSTRFIGLDDRLRLGAALGLGFLLGAAVVALVGPKRVEIFKSTR